VDECSALCDDPFKPWIPAAPATLLDGPADKSEEPRPPNREPEPNPVANGDGIEAERTKGDKESPPGGFPGASESTGVPMGVPFSAPGPIGAPPMPPGPNPPMPNPLGPTAEPDDIKEENIDPPVDPMELPKAE
jgi:hypothetical protein